MSKRKTSHNKKRKSFDDSITPKAGKCKVTKADGTVEILKPLGHNVPKNYIGTPLRRGKAIGVSRTNPNKKLDR